MAPAYEIGLEEERVSPVSGTAQYGHRGERAGAAVLVERDYSTTDVSPWEFPEGVVCGVLPLFGEAVPIFIADRPRPSPDVTDIRTSSERAAADWVANWDASALASSDGEASKMTI